jgi:uncharacterized membrane protein YphA (DoxX/SURF4 family)
MHIFDKIIRIFVGVFFIFSGLVKLNDPVGTSIKLKEYFQVFATDFGSFFEIFVPVSLPLAVFVIVLEIVLGVALLIAYRMEITAWILLALIVFFTFLTFYSAYFNKVTDCGCFGDAIPLDPWQSFYKDLVLLALVIYLFIRRKSLISGLKSLTGDLVIGISTLTCLFTGIYAIRHLPFIDFRPYKVGVNLQSAMEASEPLQYMYIMERDGKEFEFEVYPSDTSYAFKDMILMNPEAQPKITDYSVWNDDGDVTIETFTGNKLLIIMESVTHTDEESVQKIQELSKMVEGTTEAMILTAADEQSFENFRHEYQISIPYYFADHTVLEAMIRSNPGLMLLKDGIVLGKWHHNDIPGAEKIRNLLQ